MRAGLGGIPLVTPVVHVRLGRGLLFHQLGEAVEFDLGMIQAGFLRQDLRLGLLQLGLIGVLLDEEEQLPLFHQVAVLEKDLFQIALHPGPELHRIDGLGIAGKFQVIGDRLAHRPDSR